MEIPFWAENPNILLNVSELYPSESMTYPQKLNAVSRDIILLSLLGFYFTRNMRLLVIGSLTLAAIWYLYYYKNRDGFEERDVVKILEKKLPNDLFAPPISHNPFQNVLLTDYEHAADKKPAPPSYNQQINEKILSQTKQMILEENPEQPYITDKLFAGLDDDLAFEQSMRQFYSMPSTTIPNDQATFAEFCYGSMVSCKEGNSFACARNITNHVNN